MSSSGRKRNKSWASRERAGMSFLFVLAFFAVFGIIILTQVFVVDERNRPGSGLVRRSGITNRFGESIPDYEEVQDDYSDFVLRDKRMHAKSSELFKNHADSKYIVSVLSNKRSGPNAIGDKTQEKLHGGAGAQKRPANNLPWGHVLSSSVEEQLSTYSKIVMTIGPPKDAVWQTVNGTRFKFFVYSAYYDRRNSRSIRVIGATKTRNPERVWCRLFYPSTNGSDTSTTVTIVGRVKVIRENWNLKYSACFVLCPLKELDKRQVPHSVSIVSKLRILPNNLLRIQKTDHDPSLQDLFNNSVANNFTNESSSLFAWNSNRDTREFISSVPNRIGMCIKPLHFNYDQALPLIEFLELNSILGVRSATFYNHTIGPRVSCILSQYMDGTRDTLLRRVIPEYVQPTMSISLLPWTLRMESQKEIRTEGLFAALNDCLYRSLYSYSHVLFIDLDEFIIPRANRTLTELIKWLSRPNIRQSTGAFSFQNAFFYTQFPDDDSLSSKSAVDPLKRALLTQRKTQRRKKLHPHKQRSKYIAKPAEVIEAGNHFVWEFMAGKGHMNVPSSIGMLHHYRVCEFGGEDCIKAASVQDRTAHKYSSELVSRARALYTSFKTKCNLPKLAAPGRKQQQNTTTNSRGK